MGCKKLKKKKEEKIQQIIKESAMATNETWLVLCFSF